MGAATLLTLVGLSDYEQELIDLLGSELTMAQGDLDLYDSYYYGTQQIQDLGISIPPQLSGIHTVLGWPSVAVDRCEERLDLESFRYADKAAADGELAEIYEANQIELESELAHLDALIYGHAYVTVGSGDCPGDPDCPPLITVESPRQLTVVYDARLRAITAALRLYDIDNTPDTPPSDTTKAATLYLPEQTIHVVQDGSGWQVVDRDIHRLGIVLVYRLSNRQRTGDRRGTSDISVPIMSITQAACRRLLGIEVAAEYFGAPQRWILGASEADFQSADGTPRSAWETYIGRILAMERDEDGNVPEVGQFAAHDPSAQTSIIDMYARIMSAHTGLAPQYFGLSTDNPASADSIRASDAALIKRAERRLRNFGGTWKRVARGALWVKHGAPPDPAKRIEAVWRNPATPTVAASTDAAVKLVQAQILPPESDVVLDMVGLTQGQRRRVRAERRRAQGRSLIESLIPQQQAQIPAVPQERQPVEANAPGASVQ